MRSLWLLLGCFFTFCLRTKEMVLPSGLESGWIVAGRALKMGEGFTIVASWPVGRLDEGGKFR